MFETRFLNSSLLLLTVSLIFNHMAEAVDRSCPKNEIYYECGENCQTECVTLNKPCLIRHIRCPDGCYCIEGYARNTNHKCIPISQCPKYY